MPRGYRIVFIAVAGLALTAVGPEKSGPNRNQPSEQDRADKAAPSDSPIIKSVSRSDRDPGCDRGKEDRHSDLCAQWKAADAAQNSTVATWVLGSLGALIGLCTLAAAVMAARYARDAARETKRAADSAQESYDAFTSLERGRVVAETGKLLHNPPHITAAKVDIENTGKSSVTVVSAHCDFMEGCQYPGDFQRSYRIEEALSPGQQSSFTVHELTDDIINKHTFLGGYIVYRSSFGKLHKSYFLGRVSRRPDWDGALTSGQEYYMDSRALYCSRADRESRFGWPSDD